MDYTTYRAEDFVLDEAFQQWVYQPTPDDDTFWRKFLAKYPAKKLAIENARQMLLAVQADQHVLAESEVRDLKRTIHQEIATTSPANHSESPRSELYKFRPWLGWAAAFIGFLIVSTWLIYSFAQPHAARYTTSYNETKTVLLPDSSTVILNANSALTVVGSWEEVSDRTVRLEGEAFFRVKKKPWIGQKFVVRTENATIEVLGTQFNVTNRRQKTQVVLSEGQVELTSRLIPTERVLMKPGELVALSQQQPEIIQQQVQAAKYTSWTEKKLILDNTSLKSIAEILEDTYGYHVEIEGKQQAERKFSATTTLVLYDVNALLDLIEKAFDVKVHKEGKNITITNDYKEAS